MATVDTEFQEELPLLPTRCSEEKDGETNNGDKDDTSHIGYGLTVAICFALNYSIGAGILGLPYEFYNAGLVLSSLMIVFIGLLTYITNVYIIDGMIRAESITTIAKSINIERYDIISNKTYIKQQFMENQDLATLENIKENYVIDRNEYQLNELIGMFCGKWWRLAYDVTFGLSTLIVLWSYNVLFGVSLARNIGIPLIASACNMENDDSTDCRGLYSFWVLVFWVWTLTITLIDFQV